MVNTPPATILSMFDEELHSSLRTWDLPFRLLLNTLKITRRLESSDDEIETTQHRFCFQPNHDLSALSRIFISVNLFSGISYKIDLNHDDIQDNSSGFLAYASVAALRAYANHALASARVSVFICPCVKLHSASGGNLGLQGPINQAEHRRHRRIDFIQRSGLDGLSALSLLSEHLWSMPRSRCMFVR